MFEPSVLLTYCLASIAIIIVPGPTVTVIIANSLSNGSRAGYANVAGTQAGLAIMIVILALGLETIVENLSHVFTYVKLAGAAYLIWLGYKLLRSDGQIGQPGKNEKAKSLFGYFWQGFLVIWSNPKALFFFGAFIPQFIDPTQDAITQTLILGFIFMALATLLDGAYAALAGGAGKLLTRSNVRFLETVSGTCLIGGGLWLAFSKKA
ncbi:MAG: LysE family translocator [Pseudomonadota bacterium]